MGSQVRWIQIWIPILGLHIMRSTVFDTVTGSLSWPHECFEINTLATFYLEKGGYALKSILELRSTWKRKGVGNTAAYLY